MPETVIQFPAGNRTNGGQFPVLEEDLKEIRENRMANRLTSRRAKLSQNRQESAKDSIGFLWQNLPEIAWSATFSFETTSDPHREENNTISPKRKWLSQLANPLTTPCWSGRFSSAFPLICERSETLQWSYVLYILTSRVLKNFGSFSSMYCFLKLNLQNLLPLCW